VTDGLLIGLDFGTGAAKCCVLSTGGDILHRSYREYKQYHDRPGYSEHEPSDYWHAAVELLRAARVACGHGPVLAIAVSSALPSLVLVDDAGVPVTRAINLMDRRAQIEIEEIKSLVGEQRLHQLSGNRVEDQPAIVSLVWLKRHRPDLYERAYCGLTIDGYVALRLTGRATLNRSAAVFFGVAYDLRKGEFDESVLREIGIDRAKLPELVDCHERIGEVRRDLACELGLTPSCCVLGGQVDCNAAWIAAGAIEPGDFHLNLGTCGVLGVIHDDENFIFGRTGQEMVNIPYTTNTKRVFAAVAVTMSGGQVLRYLRDVVATTERAIARELDLDAYELMTLEAGRVRAGSDGLMALPYFMGERTPLWDSTARAAYVGLSLTHGRGHLIRAMMEGVGYALRWAWEVLRNGGLEVREPLIINEGGANSRLWRQIITDILELETATVRGGGGAALGDAILAGVGAGAFKDFSIARQMAELEEVLMPNPKSVETYNRNFELFKDIYRQLRRPCSELAKRSMTAEVPR
jgi:sugar (pentulose or hexulose) kinase